MDNPNLPLGWRPALDGLRGIAILAVVLFHFKTRELLPGGSLGVDLFFALSGFLITTVLLEEWLAEGRVSLSRFYVRRFLRLFPALFVFVVVVSAIRIAFRDATFTGSPDVADTLINGGLGLAYLYSWAMAFDAITPFGFDHMWSLSVEEQFYLLWPILLVLMLLARSSLLRIALATGVLALIAACMPFMLQGEGWHRLYYGADYRAHVLLIGCVGGLLFAGGYVRAQHARHPASLAAVTVAAGYVLALMLFSTDRDRWLFVVGYPLLGVAATLCVLASAFVDRGIPLTVLGNRALTYLGSRSYAIYLWHFPIGQWLRHLDAPQQLLVAGTITLLVAEASHRLVERPALKLKRRFRVASQPARIDEPEAIPLHQIDARRAAA